MSEEVIRHISESEAIALVGAANWLFGYLEGQGREIPPHVAAAFGPINDLVAISFPPEERRLGE